MESSKICDMQITRLLLRVQSSGIQGNYKKCINTLRNKKLLFAKWSSQHVTCERQALAL